MFLLKRLVFASLLLFAGNTANAAIINGDFEFGAVSFTTDPGYIYTASNSDEGQYFVGNTPSSFNGFYFNIPDHTSGSGNMLIVNGYDGAAPLPAFWKQTVTVLPFTPYEFTAWASTAVGGGPAELIVEIDGVQIGTSFVAPANPGSWDSFIRTWTSGSSTSVEIRLIDINPGTFPNDFYLDDISLVPVPEPSTCALALLSVPAFFALRRRLR